MEGYKCMIKGIFYIIYLVTFRWPRYFRRRRTLLHTAFDSPFPSMACKFFFLRTSVSLFSVFAWFCVFKKNKKNKNCIKQKAGQDLILNLGIKLLWVEFSPEGYSLVSAC